MAKTKYAVPLWAKTCRKIMIDRDMSIQELSEGTGISYTHLSSVINGRVNSEKCKDAICKFLGVET